MSDVQARQRLVDLIDEFVSMVQCGWHVPPDFAPDRFMPCVITDPDKAAAIVKHLVALGFISDASRLHTAMKRFHAIADRPLMRPSPDDAEGWKEFQRRYVEPLRLRTSRLLGVVAEVRKVVTAGLLPSVKPVVGDEPTTPATPAPAVATGIAAGDPGRPQAAEPAGDSDNEAAHETGGTTARTKKAKRSTERGEGRAKLIAALTKHHDYANGSCLNAEPIGNNELARLAGVANSTASAFFTKEFGGHTKYVVQCRDAAGLVASLKLLNQEFSPHHLFGGNPPGEDYQDDK